MPKRKSLNEFKELIKEKFNDKFEYNFNEFKNWTTPITIKCNKHGEFKMSPKQHLRTKYGCLKCSQEAQKNKLKNIKIRKKPKSGKPITKNDFLEKAYQKFGDKFTFDLSNFKDGKNNNIPITITCPIHGEFKKTPQTFLRSKHGCNKCYHELSSSILKQKSKIYYKEDFIKEALKTHGKYYIYDDIEYKGTGNKVKIICPIHGEFYQYPYLHLRGEGCPKCKRAGVTNCENRMIRLIQTKFPNLEIIHDRTQEFLKPYRYDCYIPSLKIAIEYQGSQHFEEISYLTDYRHNLKHRQELDKIKYDKSKENNVLLLYFTFSKKYKNVDYFDTVYTRIEDIFNIIEKRINEFNI